MEIKEVLVDKIKGRGLKKALLVTDKTLIQVWVTGEVIETLNKGNIEYVIFDNVKPNPTNSYIFLV